MNFQFFVLLAQRCVVWVAGVFASPFVHLFLGNDFSVFDHAGPAVIYLPLIID